MSATETTSDEVTAESVAAAEQDAAKAESALEELETRLTSGDLSVTPEQLSTQEKLVRHAKLAANGVRALWTNRQVALRAKRLGEFADEVRAQAPKSGDDLTAALHALEDAAREFQRLADEHDVNVRRWTSTAMDDFGIENRTGEAGVRIDGGRDLYIDNVHIPIIDPTRIFSKVFYSAGDPYGQLPIRPPGDDGLTAAYRLLDSIGEGL